MESKKCVFVLTFLTLYYLTQNVYAQESSDPTNGGSNNIQTISYRDWLYNTNGSKGNGESSSSTSGSNKSSSEIKSQSDPSGSDSPGSGGSESNNDQTTPTQSENQDTPSDGVAQDSQSSTTGASNGRGNEQSESGGMGSENSSGQNGSTDPGNSNDPSSVGTGQNPEPSVPATKNAAVNQQSRSVTGETGTFRNNGQSSNAGSRKGGKSNKNKFAKGSLVYQVTDFVLNPIEGATRIFLNALRRSGGATVKSIAEIASDAASLTFQAGGMFLKLFRILKLPVNIASGSVRLTGNIASRFGGVVLDAANETTVGLVKSATEGVILSKTIGRKGINATKSGIKGAKHGATYGAAKAFNSLKNFIIKDCVWYKVGITNSCIPFRFWKLTEFPFKFSLNSAILPVKLAADAALLPITIPLSSITLPIKLALGSVKVGGALAKDSVAGAKVGFTGAKAAIPSVLAGAKATINTGGQFGTRLFYHIRRFLGIFI